MHPDQKTRCQWANPKNPKYIEYHDNEWGVPCRDDKKLFEMLVLESFQAGLSWECVLNKRDAFRAAFDGFDPRKIAMYSDDKIQALMSDSGIIRNRRKIAAAIKNAQVFLDMQRQFGSFSVYLWGFTENRVIFERGICSSGLSDIISKDLKKRGMSFVGTTIVYSYLQAVGIINSHEEGCFLFPGK